MPNIILELLNIEKPILSAPMGGAVGPDFVAAVCNAGAYGVIPLWGGTAEQTVVGIEQLRALTQRNFSVNLNLSFPYEDKLQACIDTQVHAVSLFWGMEPSAIETAKRGGLVVLSTVGSVDEARQAESAGADIIVAQGWEAGGHVCGQVSTMALVPSVVDAVRVPVVAAGGIADGRGMAAALMLGASAVWIGTRFLASTEVTIHAEYQKRILAASETCTEWYDDLYDIGWPHAPHRALKNSTSDSWRKAGSLTPGARPGEGEVIGQGPNNKEIFRYQSHTPSPNTTGDIEAMSLWSGQGVSLVQEVMPAAQIVEDIYSDAKRLMADNSRRL